MFGNLIRIETGPDGRFFVNTDSLAVAIVLVALLLVAIVLASVVCYYLTRVLMLWAVGRLARGERRKWLRAAERRKVFHRLAPIVPALIVYLSAPLLSSLTFPVIAMLGAPLGVAAACFMVYTGLRAGFAFLGSLEDRYSHLPYASERPIKSFLQVATLLLYLVAFVAIVSLLLGRPPTYFLTGVSAMTALLIIVFRDSLLGFVASIQLAAYDMLRVGDWIEVPGYVADGVVTDIALNTIKVRNFDNTIVTLPSYVLLTNGVRNWRGMVESGGRRVKHSIPVDADTVRFCDDTLLGGLTACRELKLPVTPHVDGQPLTNLGMLRRYMLGYFRQHPAVRQDLPLVVRHVQSQSQGLPLEVFLYLSDTRWETYEQIQSDLFDHVYGVLPVFGLRVWQKR
ncbi:MULTISPECIES: mechanosensitive ion channel domain-containing protein [unclassified Cupriavidus]|uniref:mechanosensitive ion channel family protein n=1 Tax=unclassified Cupriavidus TaxID=2640874 RepID=UPI001C008615|nr:MULTISPECIES: mechanosensitive ion channel domain-containing protein [unclassified Cupriavidus]MCA3186217.1 mechanosensitive ion channel [Cupriavidus sp.]MCA3189550.1 mechanosensitive ion channel [Cupriavidus sp.]MCA3195630.1 mechanosensitive ion channel [Cupriavidus sp.]MCA3201185.1 mechanosensitive ion channel [Cupriavidus sp.]MCA3209000.1 mechanosensitive ion channel [Cupriavidus sp.]